MTNEELAVLIQQGDREHLATLWEQCEKLIRMKANALIRALTASKSPLLKVIDADDLTQSGFFAVLDAVKYFDPDSGNTFTTFLSDPLKTAFNDAMGRRKARQRNDPGNTALSVDAPAMVNEDGERFVDLIPDPKAESDIDRLAEDSFICYLHDLICEAISETELTEKQKQVLMIETSVDALRSLSDRLEMTGCNTRQQYTDLKGKAFKHLRKHSKIREAWKAFRDYGCDAEIASASFHRSPETIVILQEKREQKMKSARKKVKADILNTVNHSDILRLSDEELERTQQEEETRQADDREAFAQLKARMLELKSEFEENGIWYPSLQKKFAEYGIDFPSPPPPEMVTADPVEA